MWSVRVKKEKTVKIKEFIEKIKEKLPKKNKAKPKEKNSEKGHRFSTAVNRIFAVMIGVVVISCIAAAWLIVPEFFPTARTIVARSLTEQQYNNYITGKMSIKVKASVEADNGTYGDITVENTVDKITLNEGRSDIAGSIKINYADLAENNGKYEILSDTADSSMYMFFQNKENDDSSIQDGGSWYRISPKEKENDEKNVPRIIRKTLKDMDEVSYNKEEMQVTGIITASRLKYILDYFEWFDGTNMNLLQGLSDSTIFNVKLQYGKSGYHNILQSISLSAKDASAGENVSISKISIRMDITEKTSGKEINIPSDVVSEALDTEFVMPQATPIESAQPETSLQDFRSLGIILDGQKMESMEYVRTCISQSDRYTGWTVSEDGNLYQNSLITDENAQVYVYTNEGNQVTQVEFNNIYAKKNSLNFLIGGLTLGCKKEKIEEKFGNPAKTISTMQSDELHYYIGNDRRQEIVFTIYTGDQTTNSGLQKVTIFENPGNTSEIPLS